MDETIQSHKGQENEMHNSEVKNTPEKKKNISSQPNSQQVDSNNKSQAHSGAKVLYMTGRPELDDKLNWNTLRYVQRIAEHGLFGGFRAFGTITGQPVDQSDSTRKTPWLRCVSPQRPGRDLNTQRRGANEIGHAFST